MKESLIALRLFVLLTVLTGVIYPLAVTLPAQLFFGRQANGSLTTKNQKVVGSELLAQSFTNTSYFWPRPSAGNYETVASSASNQGPTSVGLKKIIEERAARLRAAHELSADAPVPAELLLASGSGLDPHLSPEAVRFQLERVSKARSFTPAQRQELEKLIDSLVEPPQLGLLGQPRINVLKLNLAVDSIR